jgi:hypothetical protein
MLSNNETDKLMRDAAPKDAATHPVRHAAAEQVTAAGAGRIFTRHGGNVLPALRG